METTLIGLCRVHGSGFGELKTMAFWSYDTVRHLILRGTKMGPQCWEPPILLVWKPKKGLYPINIALWKVG